MALETRFSYRRLLATLDQRWVHFLLIAALSVAGAWLLHNTRARPPEALDNLALDHYFALRGSRRPEDVAEKMPATRDIVLVETSHALPRPVLAHLIEQLRLAKVVALDFMLVDNEADLHDDDERALYKDEIGEWRRHDAILTKAIQRAGNVILGTWPEESLDTEAPVAAKIPLSAPSPDAAVPDASMPDAAVPDMVTSDGSRRLMWQQPPPALWRAARYHAHLRVEPDNQDGVVRSVPLFQNTPATMPCLGLAATAAALNVSPQELARATMKDGALQLGHYRIPLESGSLRVNYVGGRQCFEYDTNRIVYQRVFDAEPDDFKDKIIIVGEASLKAKEIAMTPFGTMPSMQIHANVIATLLSTLQQNAGPAGSGTLRELASWQILALSFGCCVLLMLPLMRWPLWSSAIAALGLMILLLIVGAWIFSRWNRILPMGVPIIAIALTYNSMALYEYRRARETLGRFIGRDLMPQALDIFSRLQIGGRQEEASALFCDLRGYSALSEQLPATRVSQLINEYTEALVQVVHRHKGRPIDYQGDGVFVLFEQALSGPRHAVQAVRAGIELQQVLASLRDQWMGEGAPCLEAGVGVASGTMIIGMVGASAHMKPGAMGDSVNVAAHVQRLDCCRDHAVLITRETYEQVRDTFEAAPCGMHELKGHKRPIEVFGVGSRK